MFFEGGECLSGAFDFHWFIDFSVANHFSVFGHLFLSDLLATQLLKLLAFVQFVLEFPYRDFAH